MYDSRTIITAAHCCADIKTWWYWSTFRAVAGDLVLDDADAKEQIRGIKKFLIHECKKACFFLDQVCTETPLKLNTENY